MSTNLSSICFTVPSINFSKIPGSPIAYWVSDNIIKCFNYPQLESVFTTREGMATADNDRFLRYWYEVELSSITFDCQDETESKAKSVQWVPYNKGGGSRDWYGNNDYVVDWTNDGYAIKNNRDNLSGRIRSHNYNGEFGFREGLTWSAISSDDLSVRYSPAGYLFDSKGAKGFKSGSIHLYIILGLLNSKVAMQFLEFLSPTLDFKVGDIVSIPFLNFDNCNSMIINFVAEQIQESKLEWDAFETSWDFKKHPLI